MSKHFIIHPNRVPSPYLVFISPLQGKTLGMDIVLGKTFLGESCLQVQAVKATLRGEALWEPAGLFLPSLGFGKILHQFRGI